MRGAGLNVVCMSFIRRTLTFLSLLLILFSFPLHALDTGQTENRIFDLVNAERARRNLPPCAHSPELASLAWLYCRQEHPGRGKARSGTAGRTDDRPRA